MLTGCGSMNDRTVHASLFVDHLNNMPIGKTNYFMWHNSATGNQGNVKILIINLQLIYKIAGQ